MWKFNVIWLLSRKLPQIFKKTGRFHHQCLLEIRIHVVLFHVLFQTLHPLTLRILNTLALFKQLCILNWTWSVNVHYKISITFCFQTMKQSSVYQIHVRASLRPLFFINFIENE